MLFLALSFTLLPRFSSLERFSSILTVVFSRAFHHLKGCLQQQWCFPALFIICTLLYGVLPRFSSCERFFSITVVSERFSSTSAAFAALFIVCKFSRFFYHLHFPCALLTSFPPPLVWSQVRLSVFFILCAHFPQFKFFSRLLSFTPVASFPVLTLS